MRTSDKQYIYDLCDKALRERSAILILEPEQEWHDIVASVQAECIRRNVTYLGQHYSSTFSGNKITVTCQDAKNVQRLPHPALDAVLAPSRTWEDPFPSLPRDEQE